jgi:hypothetical protein
MEFIKRKRLLENYRLRGDSDNYGKILDIKTDSLGNPITNELGEEVTNTIDIDIFITQNYEDMGMLSDETYIPFEENYDGLEINREIFGQEFRQTKLQLPPDFNPATEGRFPGVDKQQYNQPATIITGETDDRYLSNVKSYKMDSDNNPIYNINLNMASDINTTFNGVISNNPLSGVEYVIGASVNNGIAVPNTGIRFNTLHNEYTSERDDNGKINRWRKTIYEYNSHGLILTDVGAMATNVSLSAVTKVEEYFNVVSPPEVRDRVFINRGGEDIFERHSIMSEIKTRNDIDEYRDKYF